jgi:hypothetical protein
MGVPSAAAPAAATIPTSHAAATRIAQPRAAFVNHGPSRKIDTFKL